MFKLTSILLPVDFSERSLDAASFAMALARRYGAELHILHVIDLRVYGIYGMGNDGEALQKFGIGCQRAAEASMESVLADHPRDSSVKRVLQCGDPAHEIAKYAEAQKIGLIVMPTRGYGRFRRFLLGSVTTKVLHEAKCPVWTGVHLEDCPKGSNAQFQRVLCAVEPWKPDQGALDWAWQFGQDTGAEVRIVHALPPANGPGTSYFAADVEKYIRPAVLEAIATAQRTARSMAEVDIRIGEPVPEVCAAAREWNADLLVIGRGVAAEFLGRLRTRSYEIIRDSPCPVVSV